MAETIKAGDVVCLNSGGPKMTVAKIDPEGIATCTWFRVPHEKPEQIDFPAVMLSHVTNPAVPEHSLPES